MRNTTLRTAGVALRAMLVFTLVLGVGYTALITAVGQLALPFQANGSPVRDADGELIGSALIGQSFTDTDGDPLPEYFQSRPRQPATATTEARRADRISVRTTPTSSRRSTSAGCLSPSSTVLPQAQGPSPSRSRPTP